MSETPHGSWCSGEHGLAHAVRSHQGAKQCEYPCFEIGPFFLFKVPSPPPIQLHFQWVKSDDLVTKTVANKWLSILVSKVTPFLRGITLFNSLKEMSFAWIWTASCSSTAYSPKCLDFWGRFLLGWGSAGWDWWERETERLSRSKSSDVKAYWVGGRGGYSLSSFVFYLAS